jgi:hypothetical protein
VGKGWWAWWGGDVGENGVERAIVMALFLHSSVSCVTSGYRKRRGAALPAALHDGLWRSDRPGGAREGVSVMECVRQSEASTAPFGTLSDGEKAVRAR